MQSALINLALVMCLVLLAVFATWITQLILKNKPNA